MSAIAPACRWGRWARLLYEDGVPALKTKLWSSSTLGKVLSSPLYIGKIQQKCDGKIEIFQGIHEPIVTEDLWNRVAAKRSDPGRKRGGRKPAGAHLLTGGLLKCRCGYSMIPRTEYDGRYQAYGCARRVPCDQTPLSRELVDEAILNDLTKHYIDLDETRRRIEAKTAADLTIAREALAHAERESATAEATLARVPTHYQQERITPEDWSEQRHGLEASLKAAQEAVGRARDHVDEVEKAGGLEDAEESLLRHLATSGLRSPRELDRLRT